MKLTEESQNKLFAALCCLVESVTNSTEHVVQGIPCSCQLCLDVKSAQDVIDQVDSENQD